ncbi:triose-phosphate isomerase [bacterium (Candidatus Gribaldobacteria) CG_4_9_14_3_um_filter_36_15]|uniref:Triosephosphate isomerase n=4 Tax=Candidatus Gribaldobacteria TaxID=2798536 RepID=A0A2M7VKI4_9BACT|nr:MAG: triose-phosphate isomerase [Parcubacteria group bacterium CG2_30_36_21]PIR91416.1 MAG: triose-phosphate isomerase [bacterium (Candidatus Gribaldobacteria) CG10_big_fil_rev_8_21_14_0_10_37_46]PIV14164.1 MAG: triose-phosphate isomerase [bacterium (Candidatus Gribaldobacteria) CG03_land_8_20_14_0_80_36_40]PJA02276.1 MAG: triose-phosphate isomerase [bacterium (Candidatus Gribaldobacteria) CG_4_10_14_0_2_um_filter_36_18]PJB09189.1 MAG: triose-phosphate isomerase [bacterium (Candidatus Gribal
MKPLIVANWKCNPTTLKEAEKLFNSLKKGLKNVKKIEVVICPPFVYLPSFKFQASGFKLGAQDCFWEDKGPYTGEVSPQMLKSLGGSYVIVGHSERRQIFKETDEIVNEKIKEILKAKLRPIFCIGESEEEKRAGKTFQVLEREIEKGLDKVPKKEIERVIIAYEPIWAIGTEKACEENEVMTIALFIKKLISHLYNKKIARTIKILYGGSVDSKNASDYLGESKMQGLLIGGASLNSKEFIKIIRTLNSI